MSIDNFRGKYAYLSNFWKCEVEYEGDVYPSSEHAFVAAKTMDKNIRKKIISIDTPSKVKAFGRKIDLRKDWENVKVEQMYVIVKNKFERNPGLLKKLIDTGDVLLVEGNTWKDTFWGQCPIGNGQNHLGKILMRVREELNSALHADLNKEEKCEENDACSCDVEIDFDPSELISKSIEEHNKYETSLNIIDTSYRYGFHTIKYPSILKTILRVTRETPLNAMQIYISSPKSKFPPKFDYDDLLAARNEIIRSGIHVVIHGCLLYNLAGTVKGIADANYHQALASTLQGLIAELDFGVILNAGVVVHPGARDKKFDKPTPGLQCISKSIETALTRKTDESEKIAKILGITQADVIKRRKIILENAAGEGRKLCSTLEEINEVIQGVDKKLRGQVSVCIDSQHAYARGLFDWGLKGEIDKFYKEFDKIIGLKYLEVLHFNDSMESDKKASNAPFGGRKDRHQQLSEGYIFGTDERMECIVEFMLKAREHKIITIGEPPVSGMDDWILVCSLLEDTEYPLMKVITAS